MDEAGWSVVLGSAGVLAPGRWRWLRAIGWMVALFVLILTVSAVPLVTHLLPYRPAWLSPAGAAVATLLCYVAYMLAVRHGERRAPDEIAPRGAIGDVVVGWLIGLGMFTLAFASLRLIGAYTLTPRHWTGWPHDLLLTSITGLIEELIFRAVVFRLLMRAFGLWPALGLSALIFGALHLLNPHATPFAALAIAIEAGLMLASFYLLTGRIWMSVGVHAAWNFAQGSIFGARVSGTEQSGSLFTSAPVEGVPDYLSGGQFGPEASLSAIFVGLALFLIVLAAARRRSRPAG